MIDISVSNIIKSFEVGKNILDGVSFEINAGERVGLLGKNGAGKTTLFKLLTGELDSDEGSIVIGGDKRLGLISQIPHYPRGWTVADVLATAFDRLDGLRRQMEELERRMADDSSEPLLRRYGELSAAFEAGGGYDTQVSLLKVCNGLGIPERMRSQEFESLSGGEKTRINLARLILEDTDILLLDEPTNHLDMSSVEWLEEYLQKFRGTVVAISHDRYFLDRTVTRIIELVGGRPEFYNGNYSFYVREKQARFEEQLKKYEKDQAKLQQLQEAADKLHLWAFMGSDKLHKRAFSMEKRIEKLSTTQRPQSEKALKARFGQREFRGDEVMVLDGLSKSYDGKTLFSDVSAVVSGGERVALVGDNGTGKSTLAKIIMGLELPDCGIARLGPAVKVGYLPQVVSFDDPSRSLLDTLLYELGCSHQAARDRLAAFRFQGEDVFKCVSQLSGGEQSRLRLCILMNADINLLILDEPTNHLDIASREWIENALEDYEEALLLISHDRYFVRKFATRTWELGGGQLTDFLGGFEEFRAWKARSQQKAQIERRVEKKAAPPAPRPDGVKNQKQREKELARAERQVESLEKRLSELDGEIELAATDYKKLTELFELKEQTEAELSAAMEVWAELAE